MDQSDFDWSDLEAMLAKAYEMFKQALAANPDIRYCIVSSNNLRNEDNVSNTLNDTFPKHKTSFIVIRKEWVQARQRERERKRETG